ncbi:hypothetical protein ACDH70_11450 [Xanthomonas axonopodis pv. poinsettiicola]|nr:hypothetical protein [Xanthomonas codiaei]MCC8539456.1 hypothetical protein [Xanthomonas codiaei]
MPLSAPARLRHHVFAVEMDARLSIRHSRYAIRRKQPAWRHAQISDAVITTARIIDIAGRHIEAASALRNDARDNPNHDVTAR